MIANIFFWLLLMWAGIGTLKYRRTIHEWTGGWWWAEHYLGRGGTMSAISLIACLMIGLGVVKMFGKLELWPPPKSGTETSASKPNAAQKSGFSDSK